MISKKQAKKEPLRQKQIIKPLRRFFLFLKNILHLQFWSFSMIYESPNNSWLLNKLIMISINCIVASRINYKEEIQQKMKKFRTKSANFNCFRSLSLFKVDVSLFPLISLSPGAQRLQNQSTFFIWQIRFKLTMQFDKEVYHSTQIACHQYRQEISKTLSTR